MVGHTWVLVDQSLIALTGASIVAIVRFKAPTASVMAPINFLVLGTYHCPSWLHVLQYVSLSSRDPAPLAQTWYIALTVLGTHGWDLRVVSITPAFSRVWMSSDLVETKHTVDRYDRLLFLGSRFCTVPQSSLPSSLYYYFISALLALIELSAS